MEIIMPLMVNAKKITVAVLCSVLFLAIYGCNSAEESALCKAFASFNGRYAIVIIKRDFTLEVYDRDIQRVARYKIGYGSNADMKPKLFEGDNRTPEGIYMINEMLSMDAGRETESYRKLMRMNEVYFRAAAGYHRFNNIKEDLGDNVYGPRYFGINYPNEADMARYNRALAAGELPRVRGKTPGPGYGIAIHGNNDEESIGGLCSNGCIRMFNRDIVELEKYVRISTPVLIFDR